jgi:antitoxin CptB
LGDPAKVVLALAHGPTYIGSPPEGLDRVDSDLHHNRLKKLKFRASHRGFVEADLILGPFAEQKIADMSPEALDEFERLLDEPDQDLYGWIVGLKPVPPAFDTALMAELRAFRFSAFKARHSA